MRLEQLQYFVQVVESHSFNKAAQKLNITQPALTNAIRSLEEELGVQLLVRSRRGCVPTAWGVRIYEDCKSLLAELAAKIASWKKPDTGEGEPVFVPVVAIPSACNYLTEHVFSSMKQAIPLVDVVLHEAVVYELSSFLQQGKAHVGVTAFSEGEAETLIMQYREMGFVSEPLMEDEYYVFISSRHPLASKASLTVQDCSTLKLATYSNQMLERNQLFQKKIFEVIGMTQYVYVNSRENIMQMVAQNKAAGCFLHRMSAYSWYVTNGLIRALPVEGMHLMPSSHYLIHLESSALSPAERQVVDFIRRHYGDGAGTSS
ncbi:LysR family transcriptional regulator [uncultured Mailhella sp.]|uniref:LysR family transcriptional regulator n=1 Tax=uncultured Mailhella sp. TaxID=1981031 RepID=UPI0025D23C70|nr:LysR family transcriptional regulator [uncultured Mailhella sp.]